MTAAGAMRWRVALACATVVADAFGAWSAA